MNESPLAGASNCQRHALAALISAPLVALKAAFMLCTFTLLKERSMATESEALVERWAAMRRQLEGEITAYRRWGQTNYQIARALLWVSSITGIAAAVLGLVPFDKIEKWEIGILAAISTALISARQQLGLQQKSNWHFRKVDRLKQLQKRLVFELPVSPSADELAAVAGAWSALDIEMTKEWEHITTENRPLDISADAVQKS